MRNSLTAVLATLVCLASMAANAAIYRSVDKEGNISFSDSPSKNSRPVELPPLPTYEPPKYAPIESTPRTKAATGYKHLDLLSPAPSETVRDNTGLVAVKVKVDPALNKAAGHRFQYYLDGKAKGKPTDASSISFKNVDRGEHKVEVAVVDASGRQLIRSKAVTFYLHRQSKNFPRGPGQPGVQPLPTPGGPSIQPVPQRPGIQPVPRVR
ncbi:MAG TPA: DUF4124 domain-containing protein [Gammaproteobacteria bacterium]|nr:DUF4124 domain-containing protein [Gammaproteobacteria bacterium]